MRTAVGVLLICNGFAISYLNVQRRETELPDRFLISSGLKNRALLAVFAGVFLRSLCASLLALLFAEYRQ